METIQLDVILEKVKNNPQYIDYLSKLVSQKLGKDKMGTEKLLNDALAYFQDTEYTNVYRELLFLQGKNYLHHGDLDKSTEFAKEAYRFFKSKEDRQGIIRSCNNLLVSYMKKGKFGPAIDYALEGLELINPEVDHTLHLMILLNTAELYIMLKEYVEARKILNSILEMNNWLTDEHLIFIEKGLLQICLRENQIEQAGIHCQRAYAIVSKFEKSLDYVGDLCEILFLRAELNVKRELHIQAEKDYKAALGIAEKNNLLEHKVKALIAFGQYLCLQNKVEESKSRVKEAIIIAEKIDSIYLLEKAYQVLSDIYEFTKEWEEAFKCIKKVQEYNVELYSKKSLLGLDKLNHRNVANGMESYKNLYVQMKQVAKIGTCFTTSLQGDKLVEVIYQEVAKLLEMDIMGIAFYKNNELEYKIYDLQEECLDSKNDLVRYTSRLVDNCMEYQRDIMINDGNFEEYSLKNIEDSQTGMRLQSTMVRVLKIENKVLGAMILGSYKANAYSENDLNLSSIIASYLSITLHNKNLYQEVSYLAEHDALTGLLSRGAALKNGEKIFKKNHRNYKTTAVIMLAIDYFKQMNDKYGYQLGDKVLKTIGEIMSHAVDSKDYVGCYGGEEFIIILDDVSSKEIERVIERIKTQIANTSFETKKDKNIKVTLSGGIYRCNEYTLNFDDAIRFADHALYRAKILGRNRILSYSLGDVKG